MNICLSPKIKDYWIDSNSHYSMQSLDKFIKYFFNDINLNIDENVVDDKNKIDDEYSKKIDGVIYDIQDDYEISDRKLNIMLCVENCNQYNYFRHYNKFNNFNNRRIKIYFYNHIDKIELTETYIAIPIIYLQINYFQKYYNIIHPTNYTPYKHKKFCLIASNINCLIGSNLNMDHKNTICNMLSSIGECDVISNYKSMIENKSCYHSIELMNLFNQYKFVFISENSKCDGYITEKIFNCYFSRTIPIYYGSNKVKHYFNEKSFINIEENLENINDVNILINGILNSRKRYKSYHRGLAQIMNEAHDNENYKNLINNFIDSEKNKN